MKFVSAIKKLIGHGKLNATGIVVHATAGASGQSSVDWLSQIGLGLEFYGKMLLKWRQHYQRSKIVIVGSASVEIPMPLSMWSLLKC